LYELNWIPSTVTPGFKTFSVLRKQIKSSLEKKFNLNKIIIAYEPVWSIGTNKIPEMNELKNTIKFIKNDFKKIR